MRGSFRRTTVRGCLPVECIDPDPEIVETEDQLLAKLRQLQHDHPELYAEPPSE
jgi:hypothetical protein